jgi:hypothetical protein
MSQNYEQVIVVPVGTRDSGRYCLFGNNRFLFLSPEPIVPEIHRDKVIEEYFNEEKRNRATKK